MSGRSDPPPRDFEPNRVEGDASDSAYEPSEAEIEAAARAIWHQLNAGFGLTFGLAEVCARAALVAARRVLASYPPQEDA